MRRLLAAFISLAIALAVAAVTASVETAPAGAVERTQPVPVLVQGKIRMASGPAVLQRLSAHRWKGVARLVVSHHWFSGSAFQGRRLAYYRVSAGTRHSRVFAVHANPALQRKPSPSPSPSPTSSTPSCGGTTLTKPDGTAWVCTFDDEFSATALDTTKWMPQTNFVSGTSAAYACYTASSSNINESGGSLNLTVRRETVPILCQDTAYGTSSYYSAGSVMTYHLFSQEYGRFEARIKTQATTVPGLQETFWLWPDDRYDTSGTYWPASGEMDVAETYSQYPNLVIPFLHYTYNDNGGPIPGVNTAWNCASSRGSYHTYTLTWSSQTIEIDVDGLPCLINTSGDSAFQKRYIIALSALLGTGANALQSGTPLPATTNIDYVRVWK